MSRLIVPVSARAWSRVRWPATVRSVVWAIWLIAARTFSIASSAGGLSPRPQDQRPYRQYRGGVTLIQ